ncbi:hypothetical protein MIND_01251900 [Mycena indigotica]|uniref:Uncharacterized protein n=1 Tax=Mycena indigotica TaxID=2126181 RepID=A0A8H6S4U7_9AGAR|nr:uncharacterized protein MIND_01251900 [Mycena indigotica]KAF7292245.1 hypothetical protein MIND_01251900 [Mycena indigotica]
MIPRHSPATLFVRQSRDSSFFQYLEDFRAYRLLSGAYLTTHRAYLMLKSSPLLPPMIFVSSPQRHEEDALVVVKQLDRLRQQNFAVWLSVVTLALACQDRRLLAPMSAEEHLRWPTAIQTTHLICARPARQARWKPHEQQYFLSHNIAIPPCLVVSCSASCTPKSIEILVHIWEVTCTPARRKTSTYLARHGS